jgi:hypothetical protein
MNKIKQYINQFVASGALIVIALVILIPSVAAYYSKAIPNNCSSFNDTVTKTHVVRGTMFERPSTRYMTSSGVVATLDGVVLVGEVVYSYECTIGQHSYNMGWYDAVKYRFPYGVRVRKTVEALFLLALTVVGTMIASSNKKEN